MLNLGLKGQFEEGVQKLGFTMEDLLEKERDAALGNGGLGRLAACYLDSSASQVMHQWSIIVRR
jgi:starch phosphorylase